MRHRVRTVCAQLLQKEEGHHEDLSFPTGPFLDSKARTTTSITPTTQPPNKKLATKTRTKTSIPPRGYVKVLKTCCKLGIQTYFKTGNTIKTSLWSNL